MTAVSSLSNLAAAAGTGADGAKDPSKELNDRFLKLLVAQMNNQDPLNPLDNAQVTSQMAQINTVTGINGLNDTVEKLLSQFGQMQALQAAQLTGRSVLVAGQEMRVSAAGANTFGLQLPSSADKVTVEIRDAAGGLVRTLDLGKADGGISRYSWDGKNDAGAQVAAGRYTMTVTAVAAGKELGATPLVTRTVEAVSNDNGTTTLMLAGGGSVSYADVKQIL
jgi:flagellar basal-body rod modification protein FlgD